MNSQSFMTEILPMSSDKVRNNMKTAYFWLTAKAKIIAEKLQSAYGGFIFEKDNLKENVKSAFYEYDALVFVMASGIAVRMIAEYISDKSHDPAVIVIDQNGEFVISLLSGHIGGANRLAEKLAGIINAVPVITTATDRAGVISFDEFAVKNDIAIENLKELKYISSRLVDGGEIDLVTNLDTDISDKNINISEKYRGNESVILDTGMTVENPVSHILYLRPRIIYIGTGCKKNTDPLYYEQCFMDFLSSNHINPLSVKSIATIALKENESCINSLCRKYGYELEIISQSDILKCGDIFEKSEFVEKITGVPSVAESTAYIASGYGKIICGKTKYSGITFSMAQSDRRIKK